MRVLVVAGARLGRLARAYKAHTITRLAIRGRGRVLVNAHAVTCAVGRGSLAASGCGEAAEVDGRGGRVFSEAANGRGGGDVSGAGAGGDHNLGLRDGERRFGAAAELGGRSSSPMRNRGSARGFGEEEDGRFEVGGGNVLSKEVEVLDESLDGGVVLVDGSVLGEDEVKDMVGFRVRASSQT